MYSNIVTYYIDSIIRYHITCLTHGIIMFISFKTSDLLRFRMCRYMIFFRVSYVMYDIVIPGILSTGKVNGGSGGG